MDFMCRTCMERNKNFVNIFEYKENNKLLSNMLFECTSIRIQKNDGLPLRMCSECLERLTSAWYFRVMVNEIDSKLHTIINRSGKENPLQHSKYIDMTVVKEETTVIKNETCNLSVQENVDINSSLKLRTCVKNICHTDKSLDTGAEANSNSHNDTNVIYTVAENSKEIEKDSLITKNFVIINNMKRKEKENPLQHSKYIDMTIVKEETTVKSEICDLSVQENVDINSCLKLDTCVRNIFYKDKSLDIGAEEKSNSHNDTNVINTLEENSLMNNNLVNINTMKKKLCKLLWKDESKNNLDNKVIENLTSKNNISFKTYSEKECKNSVLKEKLLKCSKEKENNTLSINKENQNNLLNFLNINECSNENTSLFRKSIGQDCNVPNIESIEAEQNNVMEDEPKHLQINENNLAEILLTNSSPTNIDQFMDTFDSHDDELEQEKNKMEADTKELELHSEKINKKLTKKETEKMSVFCETCNRSFGYRYYFEIHVRHHSGDKKRKCDICGKAFVRQFQLRIHMAIHSDERPFSCEICGKTFKVLSSLLAHKFVHSDTSYFCNICQKSFKNKILLRSHTKRHGKTFTCEVCGKSFGDPSSFYKHKIVHVDEKKVACPTCGKTFKTKQTLREHLKSHSEARPYSCSHCGKGFKTKEVMDNHILIHTGERPYSCKVCDKSFRQSSTLYYHMRIHTGETPYACKLCPSQFKYSHHLQNHMKIHK